MDVGSVVAPVVDNLASMTDSMSGPMTPQQVDMIIKATEAVLAASGQLTSIAELVLESFQEPMFRDALQTSITNVKGTIKRLSEFIEAFKANYEDKDAQAGFIREATDLGVQIGNLLDAADPAAPKKILAACDAAAAATKRLAASTKADQKSLVAAAQEFALLSLHVVRLANVFGTSSGDEKKQHIASEAAGEVRVLSKVVIQSAQAAQNQPENIQQFNNKVKEYGLALRKILLVADAMPPKPPTVEELILSATDVLRHFAAQMVKSAKLGDRTAVSEAQDGAAETIGNLISNVKNVIANTTDPARRQAITNALNIVIDAQESLPAACEAVLSDPNDPEANMGLAATLKMLDVGCRKLEQLMNPNNISGEEKLLQSVNAASGVAKGVIHANDADTLAAVKSAIESVNQLQNVAQGVLGDTLNHAQSSMISDAMAELDAAKAQLEAAEKAGDVSGIKAALLMVDLALAKLQAACTTTVTAESLEAAREASKDPKQSIQYKTVLESLSDIDRLMKAAKAGDGPGVIAAARDLASRALALAKAAETEASLCSDPERATQLIGRANAIKSAAKGILIAAKECADNPSKESMMKLEAARDILLNTFKDELLSHGVKDADAIVFGVVEPKKDDIFGLNVIGNDNDDELVARAKEQVIEAQQLSLLGQNVMESASDEQKKHLTELLDGVSEASRELLATSRAAAANPNDTKLALAQAKAQEKFNTATAVLASYVHEVQADAAQQKCIHMSDKLTASIEDLRAANASHDSGKIESAAKTTKEDGVALISAGKQFANDCGDLKKSDKMNAAVVSLESTLDSVSAAAAAAAAKPDKVNEKALDAVLDILAKQTHNVQNAMSDAPEDHEAMMALQKMTARPVGGSPSAVNEFSVIVSCGAMGADIQNFLAEAGKMNHADLIGGAKNVAKQCADLASQVKQVLATITDKELKSELDRAYKFLRDASTQLKILAMVRSQSDSSEDSSVISAVKNIQSTIFEVNEIVRRASLRRRITQAVTQVLTIKRAVNALKRKLRKKKGGRM